MQVAYHKSLFQLAGIIWHVVVIQIFKQAAPLEVAILCTTAGIFSVDILDQLDPTSKEQRSRRATHEKELEG